MSPPAEQRLALRQIAEQAARALRVQRVGIALYMPERDELEFVASMPEKPEAFTPIKPGRHVSGRAFSERRTIIDNGYETRDDPYQPAREHHANACMATPLMIGSEALGVLIALDTDGRHFDEEDAARLERIAPLAALAVVHARLLQQTARELEIVNALADIRVAATSAAAPAACAMRICQLMESVLPRLHLALYTLEADGSFLRLLGAGSRRQTHELYPTLAVDTDNVMTRSLASDRLQVATPGDRAGLLAELGLADAISMGLRDGGRTLGVLSAGSPSLTTEADRELFVSCARAASMGIALALGVDAQRRAERRAQLIASLALAAPPDGMAPDAAMVWLADLAQAAGQALDARCEIVAKARTLVAEGDDRSLVSRARSDFAVVRAGLPATRMAVAVRASAGEDLGVLLLTSSHRALGLDDEVLLGTIAARVAGAVDRGRLEAARRRAEREKDDILSIVAHELRTPITSLRGFATATLDGFDTMPAPRVKRALSIIERQAKRMGGLVEDLIDVSRMERGHLVLRREVFDISEVAADVIERVAASSPRHDISLAGTREARVNADPSRIEQVLFNLIGNAVRYSPEGGRVWVELELEPEQQVRVDVRDQGIGVAKVDGERIFGRFQRSTGPDSEIEPGLGLGLYIAREIIERHNGKLWLADSEPGRGSTFSFRLAGEKVGG